MKRWYSCFAIFLWLLCVAALPSLGQSQPQSTPISELHKPAPTVGPLMITFGDKSATWTVTQLTALPQTTVTVNNEHTKANETYTGVPLIDLLKPLGVHDAPRGKDLRLYLVAAGSDGYEAVYAIGEVTPEVNNSTVMVAHTENGAALKDDGPLKLIATNEKRPARWVRNLVSIRVLAAE